MIRLVANGAYILRYLIKPDGGQLWNMVTMHFSYSS